MKYKIRLPNKSEVAGALLGAGIYFYIGYTVGEDTNSEKSACAQSLLQSPVKSIGNVAVTDCAGLNSTSDNKKDIEALSIEIELGLAAIGAVLGVIAVNRVIDLKRQPDDILDVGAA